MSHLLLEQYAVIQKFLPATIFPFQKQVCFSIFVPYTLCQLLSKHYFNAPLCTGHHCNKRHWPKKFQFNLLTVCLLLGSTNSSTSFVKICNFFWYFHSYFVFLIFLNTYLTILHWILGKNHRDPLVLCEVQKCIYGGI